MFKGLLGGFTKRTISDSVKAVTYDVFGKKILAYNKRKAIVVMEDGTEMGIEDFEKVFQLETYNRVIFLNRLLYLGIAIKTLDYFLSNHYWNRFNKS